MQAPGGAACAQELLLAHSALDALLELRLLPDSPAVEPASAPAAMPAADAAHLLLARPALRLLECGLRATAVDGELLALLHEPRLRVAALDLRRRLLAGSQPAKALGAALGGVACARLTELSLAFNTLGNAGAASIADALQAVPSLRRLFLGFNDVGDPGACALAAVIATGGASRQNAAPPAAFRRCVPLLRRHSFVSADETACAAAGRMAPVASR